MRFLVAYDVCNPKRLRQVARVLKSYGIRIEKSVFVCEINQTKATHLCQDLYAKSAEEDTILCFALPTTVQCVPIRGELITSNVLEIY